MATKKQLLQRIQQEVPGEVACEWRGKSLGEHHYVNVPGGRRCIKCKHEITTPPAPVDVRVPMSRIIELLAQLVNAPQTNDEFDADVIRRDVVMEKVTQLRMAWDELSKAQRALLDGQPAGVERG